MPGVWGINSEQEIENRIDLSCAFHNEPGVDYLSDSMEFSKGIFGRISINKFRNDKIFKQDGDNLIGTDGIIFNSKQLQLRKKTNDLADLISKLYNESNWRFVNELRGNFSGFLYSQDNRLVIFTDHLASKPVYYFHDNGSNTLIFASELKVVVKGMRQLGFIPHLDVKGAYYLLTFAYMLGDTTTVKEVKKLPPGNVLIYENGSLSLKEYYTLLNEPCIEASESEIIREIDQRFKDAVRLEYEKDLEYGYSHLATLSGGLDSRTNVAYAKKLGFENITCFTFSESNYLDEKIAKKICSDKNFEFIFYALDNGTYLLNNINQIISSNDGQAMYSGAAHTYNCLKNISFQHFGLIHTGQIGDAVIGASLYSPLENKSSRNLKAYSNKLTTRVEMYFNEELSKYPNIELFNFYNRAINGAFNGYRMADQFTEFSSPFLYIDFLDYASKLNPKKRYKHALYLKWINTCMPDFTGYKWEKYGIAPRYPLIIMNGYIITRNVFRLIIRRFGFNSRYTSMNPTEYWWKTNDSLQRSINKIYRENLGVIENYPKLLEDASHLFSTGSLLEKTQVITLLNGLILLDLQ